MECEMGFCLSLVLLLSAGAVQGTPSLSPSSRPDPLNFAKCSLARDSGSLSTAPKSPDVTNVNGPFNESGSFVKGLNKIKKFINCSADFTFTIIAAGSKFPDPKNVRLTLLSGESKGHPCNPTRPCPLATFFGRIRKPNKPRPGRAARFIYTMRFSRIVVSNYFGVKTRELNVCAFLDYECPNSQPLDGPSLHP